MNKTVRGWTVLVLPESEIINKEYVRAMAILR